MTRVHNSWIGAAVRLMLIIVCLIDIQPKVNTKVFFSLPTCKICTIHTNVKLVSLVEELNFHNANRVQTFQSFNQNAPHSNLSIHVFRDLIGFAYTLSLALTEKDGEKSVHWSVFFKVNLSCAIEPFTFELQHERVKLELSDNFMRFSNDLADNESTNFCTFLTIFSCPLNQPF